MDKETNKFLYWTPRILSIIFIIFISLFSFDVISSELSLGQIIIGLFMHNIPTLILLVALIIAWKHEIVGGVAFLAAGLFYIIFATRADVEWYIALSWSLTIAGPAFLTGALFMVNWFNKKKTIKG